MTILKSGTPTGFQDKNGKDIKTADRIKHVLDGSILTIDKFARAVSPLGFKYDLLSMHVQRGMKADGTYYSRLSDYELTDEIPPKHEGETVRLGTDADNMAPDRVRDPRNERLHGPRRRKGALRDMEAEAVQDGCTPEEARRILTLQDYQDEDLCDELRDRGYHGEITKTKTIKI